MPALSSHALLRMRFKLQVSMAAISLPCIHEIAALSLLLI